ERGVTVVALHLVVVGRVAGLRTTGVALGDRGVGLVVGLGVAGLDLRLGGGVVPLSGVIAAVATLVPRRVLFLDVRLVATAQVRSAVLEAQVHVPGDRESLVRAGVGQRELLRVDVALL